MQAKAAEWLSTNSLHGYKFNINDFTQYQVNELICTCLKFGGNDIFKKKLKDLLHLQIEERDRFYKSVAHGRQRNTELEKITRCLQKLSFPERWISKLLKEKAVKTESFDYWQPPESETTLIARKFSPVDNLAALLPGSASLTGWERVRRAFFPSYFVPNYCNCEKSHTYNRNFCLIYTFAAAVFVGMIMGVGHGRSFLSDFDRTNLSNMYFSKADAIRSRHEAFIKGYGRFMFKWWWRIGFIVGSMFLISQSLSIYNLNDKMSYYVLGTGMPLSLYNWKRGPKGMLLYGISGGLLVGVPTGFFMANCGLNPRPWHFDWEVQPVISSPYHHYNWTEEKKQLSGIRFKLLLQELNQNYTSIDKVNNEWYDEMLSPLH